MFIDIGLLDDGVVDGNVEFEIACTSPSGDFVNYGTFALTVGSDLEVPGLPVGETCSPIVTSTPQGLLIDVGEWTTIRIGPNGSLLQLLAGTGTQLDELIIDMVPSEKSPPLATEADVHVSCSDGTTFTETISVPGRAVLEPIALGANCTATVTDGPGIAFDTDQQRTKVLNFGIDDDGLGDDSDAIQTEFGDLFFVVSAPETDPPIAVDDMADAMVGEGEVFIDVLSNDQDPNEDIDSGSLTIVTPPSLGTAEISGSDPTRGIIYTPLQGGIDTLAYMVCDTQGSCDTATVTITVLEPTDCTILGTPEPDVLTGTNQDDIICGMAGDDEIDGKGGNDVIFAGSGADVVRGGNGDDIIVGGRGSDILFGANGSDLIRGQRGHDTIYGGNGADVLRGGRGSDTIHAGNGDDELYGGRHADVLNGGSGDDVLRGRSGDDMLFGDAGSDVLRGGSGFDHGDGGKASDECINIEVPVSCR